MKDIINVDLAIENMREKRKGLKSFDRMVIWYDLHVADGHLQGDFDGLGPRDIIASDREWLDAHQEMAARRLQYLVGEPDVELDDSDLGRLISQFRIGLVPAYGHDGGPELICNGPLLKRYPGVREWMRGHQEQVKNRVRELMDQTDKQRKAREERAREAEKPALPAYGHIHAEADLDQLKQPTATDRMFATATGAEAKPWIYVEVLDAQGASHREYPGCALSPEWDPDTDGDFRDKLRGQGLEPVGEAKRDGSLLRGEVISVAWRDDTESGCAQMRGSDIGQLMRAEKTRNTALRQIEERATDHDDDPGAVRELMNLERARVGVRQIDDAQWWCDLAEKDVRPGDVVFSIFAE